MHAIVFLVIAAPPEFRDWSTEDGLITAKYCWTAFDDVQVELDNGRHRKLKFSELSRDDREYVTGRHEIAKHRKPRIRIAETRKNLFWGDPGRRAYWAKERVRRRNRTIAKFDRYVQNAEMAAKMSPLANARILSQLYNGPPTPRRRPADIVVEYSWEMR